MDEGPCAQREFYRRREASWMGIAMGEIGSYISLAGPGRAKLKPETLFKCRSCEFNV